jgi:probable rRNA maturation factor
MAQIDFFAQDISFKLFKPAKTRLWIKHVIRLEKKHLAHINYIFCSDLYLLGINKQYLNHRTLTDIITFDTSEGENEIEGDVFMSIERVQANAAELATTFDDELHRVMIHGVLHLVGYADKSAREKSEMRKKEDAYLSLRSNL